jgi:hypothetical protein
MIRRLKYGFALALMIATAASGAALAADPERGTFSVILENDLFYGADRDYTNGVQLAWTSGADRVPGWLLDAARAFPLFPAGGTVRVSYALGQTMYTPRDTTLANPPLDDRPYGGWLYGAVGLVAETGRTLDQIQLQVGVVGPASLAEDAQKFIHRLRGIDLPQGWDHQIKNEPGVVFTYQRSWRALVAENLWGVGFDLTPHLGAAVGNIFTYANAGATVRVGWNLPDDYGPPRIQPSLPGSGFFVPDETFGFYFFAGVEGRAVARNIFLDGNTWQSSRSVDKEIFVGDAQFGFAATLGAARLAYTHVFRTREFRTQRTSDEFGSVSLSVRF